MEEIILLRDQRLAIQQGQSYPLLVISPHTISFERAALNYLKSEEGMVGITAGAILLNNWVLTSIARLLCHPNGKVPVHFFYKIEKALSWLKGHQDQKTALTCFEPIEAILVGRHVGNILTEREREIAMLVMQGVTTEEIAVRLYITLKTAKKHRENINRKTATNNTLALRQWWDKN